MRLTETNAPRTRPALVAVDIDGTVLTSRHEVTDAVAEAVAHVRARGVTVLPVTSRYPRALWPILVRLGLVEPVEFVASQGGLTGAYTRDGRLRVVERRSIPVDLAWAAAREALRAGLAVSWYTSEDWFVSEVDDEVAREAEVVGFDPVVVDVLDLAAAPDKLLLIGQDAEALAALMPAGLCAQTSNPTYLEITGDGVDKGSALRAYCDRHGIPPASVVAFGDGMNDLLMFGVAGTSVAPANARPEVLAAATFVTASNDEDGVARALRILLDPA